MEVRGDLIRWARQQRGLSQRAVTQAGGPTSAYQTEVENGKKTEVSGRMLERWLAILAVPERFVRDGVPRYQSEPDRCLGLAADVGLHLRPDFRRLPPDERAPRALALIARESRSLSATALAYLLDVDIHKLEQMATGRLHLPDYVIRALADLTLIPESFLTGNRPDSAPSWLEYLDAVHHARLSRVSPGDLVKLIDGWCQAREMGIPMEWFVRQCLERSPSVSPLS